jgi:hypothetical protein
MRRVEEKRRRRRWKLDLRPTRRPHAVTGRRDDDLMLVIAVMASGSHVLASLQMTLYGLMRVPATKLT